VWPCERCVTVNVLLVHLTYVQHIFIISLTNSHNSNKPTVELIFFVQGRKYSLNKTDNLIKFTHTLIDMTEVGTGSFSTPDKFILDVAMSVSSDSSTKDIVSPCWIMFRSY